MRSLAKHHALGQHRSETRSTGCRARVVNVYAFRYRCHCPLYAEPTPPIVIKRMRRKALYFCCSFPFSDYFQKTFEYIWFHIQIDDTSLFGLFYSHYIATFIRWNVNWWKIVFMKKIKKNFLDYIYFIILTKIKFSIKNKLKSWN